MLVNKTVTDLLDAFAAPTPTPGGGSAAALAGAMAAALLEMVAQMPKTKNNTPEDRAALDAALPALKSLRAKLTELVDKDSASYDAVVAAYKLPKATDDEKAARKAAVRDAMRGATEVPLETARASFALAHLARPIAEHGNPNAKSDVSVALGLAMQAAGGARANVEINVDSVGDPDYAAAVRADMEKAMVEAAMTLKATTEALGWKGHTPPRS
ncbi:MAG TPA: cyclodeaminase/cyclohydrolase family protein [Vicinamibacterales bacterium]|nr:cyclodeaminase/cyclohydrolase family protein [Vicinamibacterales bacterium]